MTKELEQRESPLLPEFIKSARRRNPQYSLEWTEANAVKLLANRKAKATYRKAQEHLSNGGTLWLRATNPHNTAVTFRHPDYFDVRLEPNESVYTKVTIGPKSTNGPDVFIYAKSVRGEKEALPVKPDELIFGLPESRVHLEPSGGSLRDVTLYADDLRWLGLWHDGWNDRLICSPQNTI